MGKESEFVVYSKGYCFLCLNQVATPQGLPPEVKLESSRSRIEHELVNIDSPLLIKSAPLSTFSLQCLSTYLGMDMGTVFNEKETVPKSLLTTIQRSKLKVELCQECAPLSEKFSKLYRQLVKVEMEVISCLGAIHRKLVNADKFPPLTCSKVELMDEVMEGKFNILKVLRVEAEEKCFLKLKVVPPQVKVQNLTMKQINAMRATSWSETVPKYFPSSSSSLDELQEDLVKVCDVKLERSRSPNEYLLPDEDPLESESSSEGSPEAVDGSKLSGATPPIPPSSRIDPKSGKHICSICSKRYSNSGNFQAHFRVAHLKVRYKCSYCAKIFAGRSPLKAHINSVHRGITYKCKICSRSFVQKFNLRVHLQTTSCRDGRHAKPRRIPAFNCHLCDKRMTSKSSLEIHLKVVHLQLREHECQLCGRGFGQACALKRHLLTIHSRLRNHKCNLCAKKFAQKCILNQHVRRCHPPSVASESLT